MTDLLVEWANAELELTRPVSGETFEEDFANGKLLFQSVSRQQEHPS
jgi:hypothetical protein